MLRLKQIDLAGFKSFKNRERLKFAGSGLAAVVGPNGCGKSNICDAVNWVLGEQSAKSLRGERMHDVIFAGTRDRKPSGMANVTLTLHDPDGTVAKILSGSGRSGGPKVPASAVPGQVAVTRKLFSDGNSQYILNGKNVRLRDVQHLFLGTGLGPNHYAIIEQGRIGQLLTAHPLDRRAFVEEAAGVTRFKADRKLAELKLANTELNLERVHDILQEVTRQSNSLKRQASRAKRYEAYQEELREALCLMLASEYRQLEAERAELESKAATAKEHWTAMSEKAGEMEDELSGKRQREQEWEAQLDVEQAELSDLRVEQERAGQRIAGQSRTISENRARQEQAAQDLETAGKRAESLEASAMEERRAAGEQRRAADELRQSLDSKELERKAQQGELAATNTEQESCQTHVIETLNALSDAKARLGKLDETLAGYDTRLERAQAQAESAASGIAAAKARRDARQAEAVEANRSIAERSARRETLSESLKQATAKLDELRKGAEVLRANSSGLAARRESVQEMLRHRDYSTEAVKDIFDAMERDPGTSFRPLGVLADFLEVDAGYEKAIEQFLADDLEHVVVGDWSEAGKGAQLVRDEFGGRAAFLLVERGQGAAPASPPAIESAVPLTSHVRMVARGDGPIPALLPKLRDGYLVEDHATAERLAGLHPELYFLLADGTWYQGPVVQVGRKSSSGPLVLKQQLRDLAPQLQDAERALAQAEQEIEGADDAVRRDGAELETVRAGLQDLEKAALAAQHELDEAERTITELEQQAATAAQEIERLGVERSSADSSRGQAQADRDRLEGEHAEANARGVRLAEQAKARQAACAKSQEEETELRTGVAAMDERLRAGLESAKRAEAALADERGRMLQLQNQIQSWTAENEEFAKSNEKLAAEIEAGKERRAELERRIESANQSLKESRSSTNELMEESRKQRAEVEAAQGRFNEQNVALARVKNDMGHLETRCATEIGQSIGEVAGRAPEAVSEQELAQAQERHREIREKLDSLGPVNVLAAREYEEVAERETFLEAQQQDLVDAMRNTREAIREIDVASRERFDEAFEAINENFRTVFSTLFGGGIGELRLTNPDDVDGSGVEIVAQPPGKRLQRVALLSGGEKSLTVMALLMATFRHRPSPFCILDEADSQLDEANTIRLRGLLQEMAPETQFVVITHSKTMMEAAETLYGVTMGEPGVSTLVSVRMSDSKIEEMPQGDSQDQAVEVA